MTHFTQLAPVDGRPVIRCHCCKLVQFRTNGHCVRSHQPLETEEKHPLEEILRKPKLKRSEWYHDWPTAVFVLRSMRGLSQRQLAARAGVVRTYVSKVESGKVQEITIHTGVRLAKALGVSMQCLCEAAHIIGQA